jgi:hypothetical protein
VSTKIVKQVAVGGDRVAVTYWGGTVRVFDLAGKLRHEHVFPRDVALTGWIGGRLVVGLANGGVIALQPAPEQP